MQVDEVLARMGGVADASTLADSTSRGRIRTAVRRAKIVRDSRGRRLALPTADAALRVANALSGVVTDTSAAAY